MSHLPQNLVCFDEAGNTGQHLTDPIQPVFTTAGALVSDEDLAAIRDLLEWRHNEELHFSVLKRSRSGRGRIISLCQSEFASTRLVKAFAIHKAYLVTTKIIDMLMEPLAHEYGLDLYERGGHLATANLFHSVGPVFCGRGLYDQMVTRFVQMIRTGTPEDTASFYACLQEMYSVCSDRTFASGIATLIATRPLVPGILRQRDITELDPAIPAFLQVATAWDQDLLGAWEVVHDDSKPLAVAQDVIECFFANDEEPRRKVGKGPRAVRLPLKATGLRFASSAAVPGLQVADLFASSLAYYLRGVDSPPNRGDLWEPLRESRLMEIGVGGMWPSTEVDPEELEMEEFDGSWVDASSDLIGRGLERRYGADWSNARRGASRERANPPQAEEDPPGG